MDPTPDTDSSAIGQAQETLLRALDQLESAEEDLEDAPERVDLVVIYSIGRDDQGDGSWFGVRGWAATSGPKWLHAALLRRAARSFDDAVEARDNEPDDD